MSICFKEGEYTAECVPKMSVCNVIMTFFAEEKLKTSDYVIQWLDRFTIYSVLGSLFLFEKFWTQFFFHSPKMLA